MIAYYVALLTISSCSLIYPLQLASYLWSHFRSQLPVYGTTRVDARFLRVPPFVCSVVSVFGCGFILRNVWSSSSQYHLGHPPPDLELRDSMLVLMPNSTLCMDETTINLDIGGIGVLLGLFLPCILLLLVLISGHFKAERSGAKEVCMAQCACMSCHR